MEINTFKTTSRRLASSMLSFCCGFVLITSSASANTYPLPPQDSDVIGRIQHTVTKESDTLVDIARQYGLGYDEITAANPDIDPWLPGEGSHILLPTRFILPDAPREGVVINVAEMRLYYFPKNKDGTITEVMTFPIGIGRQGWSTPLGNFKIKDKFVKPSWTIPDTVMAEYEARGITKPKIVPPGPDNPLGDFALALTAPGYFIHGTNNPSGVGMRVSHGCLRLYPEDIDAIFQRIPRGTPVRIINQPYKAGLNAGSLFIEAHKPLKDAENNNGNSFTPLVASVIRKTHGPLPPETWDKIKAVADQANGIPSPVTRLAKTKKALGKSWMLQVGVFKNREKARQLLLTMEAIDLPASFGPCDIDGSCRVLVGPYTKQTSVTKAAQKISQTVGINSFVLQVQDNDNPSALELSRAVVD
jgi:L,D-transpeptidase ErfK/SrfK